MEAIVKVRTSALVIASEAKQSPCDDIEEPCIAPQPGFSR